MRKGGSKNKGSQFEIRIWKDLKKIDPRCHRTCGSGSSPDDKGDISYKNYRIECKAHKRLSIKKIDSFWEKICDEAEGVKGIPLLIFKENHKPALVMSWQYVCHPITSWHTIRFLQYYDEWLAIEQGDLEIEMD